MKKVIFAFKIYYLVYVLIAFTAMLNEYKWFAYSTWILVLFGIVVLLGMLLQFKIYLNTVNIVLILIFIGSYALSMLITWEYGFLDNIKELFWLMFPMLILYVGNKGYTKEEMKNELKILAIIYVVYSTIAGLISISMIAWGKNFVYKFGEGQQKVIGFKWGRLWGVFDDPNHGATILVAGIILAVCLIVETKQLKWKVCGVVAIVVQYAYVILSDSRTGLVATEVAIFCGTVFLFLQKLHIRQRFLKVVCALFSAMVITLAIAFIMIIISSEVDKLYNKYDKEISSELKERKIELSNDNSNGRIEIWKSGFDIIEKAPIFGVSFRNIIPYAEDNIPDSFLINNENKTKYDSLHNVLMDIIVSQGIIGLFIACTMMINTLLFIMKF